MSVRRLSKWFGGSKQPATGTAKPTAPNNSKATAASKIPDTHAEVDYSKWAPPGEGDVRSPCPAINSLANHGILPRNGKAITKAMAVKALTTGLGVDPSLASFLAAGALPANPDHHAHSFDLDMVDKHGYIEHDVSLSRDDVALGSNSAFSKERFDEVFATLSENAGEDGRTTWAGAGKARYARVKQSEERHKAAGKDWTYGIKEAILSYGETALYLNLLGKDGVAPLKWVKTFFEEERLPYVEGWRPPTAFGQSQMNHGYAEMIKASEHKLEEAEIVGVGTVEALEGVVVGMAKSLNPSMCVMM